MIITRLYLPPTPTTLRASGAKPSAACAAMPVPTAFAPVVRTMTGAAAVSGLSICARRVALNPLPAARPLTLSLLTADERIATGLHKGVPAYRPRTLAAPPLGTFPTITLNPRPGSMPGINDRTRPVMQAESRAQELANNTQGMKRLLIRIVSRDGVIDDEEMLLLQQFNDHKEELEEKAEDEAFGFAMIRRGRDSDRVIRLGRQMFGDGDSAA